MATIAAQDHPQRQGVPPGKPHGEKPVLKLVFAAMTGAAELDHEYEAENGLANTASKGANPMKLSSKRHVTAGSIRYCVSRPFYRAFPPNFSAVRMAPRPSSDSSTVTSVSVPVSSGNAVTWGK